MERRFSRREVIMGAGATLGAAAAPAQSRRTRSEPFTYCLNTSTLRGHKLDLPQEIEIAAKAGYSGMEPWIGEIEAYVKGGGSLKDLAKRFADNGITVESAIGFAEWIVDDDSRRARGLEQARRDMDLVAQIGGKRIAAPPAGATDQPDMPLQKAAERYRALLELGDRIGVVPMVELWGFSRLLNRLGQVAYVAVEAGHPDSCILADVYHVYKGGSDYQGLRLLGKNAMRVLHVNDYPADPPRETIRDEHRVYPGDGIAPLNTLFRDLYQIGFRGALSLELFNKEYYQQDALTVAKTGLEKTRAAVRRALENVQDTRRPANAGLAEPERGG